MARMFFILSLTIFFAPSALAVNPGEILEDSNLEARARDISKGIRCVVCQNQSIDDSDATLARDLRILVRERLTAGDSNTQVVDYLVSRYGDFILLKPPFKVGTFVLWLGPFALFALAFLVSIIFFRRQKATLKQPCVTPALNREERERLDKLVKD